MLPAFRRLLASLWFVTALSAASAQTAGSGTIQGRVLNDSTGNYLTNARVAVAGTALEAYTTNTGDYILTNVPAGAVTVVASYVGLETRQQTVSLAAGSTARQDFGLSVTVVELEPMSVTARAMSGQAVALTEQKNARNIKNVIAIDEFVDMADGNLGEFIKFVPGVDIRYNPFTPSGVNIRGMPREGTLVQMDGVPTAPGGVANSRAFDFNVAANANIDRIEVSKVPTPDMPANAVGGSINIISKSGFSRATPLFSYNIYASYNDLKGRFSPSLDHLAGPDGKSTKRSVNPSYDLSYILPLNQQVAFTFALVRTARFNPAEFHQQTWNQNTGLLVNNNFQSYLNFNETNTAKATVDWKVGKHSTLQASYTDTQREGFVRNNQNVLVYGAGATGGPEEILGAAGAVGTASQAFVWNNQYRSLSLASLKFRHDGPVWKLDAHASLSEGGLVMKDRDDGFFGGGATSLPNLRINARGLSGIRRQRIPVIDAFARTTNAPVNVFDGNLLAVNSLTSNQSTVDNEVRSVGLNIGRSLDLAVPTDIKVGVYGEQMNRNFSGGVLTYAFNPPGGAAARLASLHGLVHDEFSDRMFLKDVAGGSVNPRYISLANGFDLYRQNPSWFTLNEVSAHTNVVNSTIDLEETITAGYVRLDHRFRNNRLKLTYGVRYEHTEDDGAGPLNDISATYQRDANGNFLRAPDGALVKKPGTALELAELQFQLLGSRKKTSYDGFYPTVNASYDLTENIVMRAGYAKTIGRPELDQIIPSTVITDPALTDVNRTIRVVDGSLQPWSADNYDLTFEIYDLKGATASLSLFQKDLSGFFRTDRRDATQADLEELGLTADYLDYDVIRTMNAGEATIRGYEISYRQTLNFIPRFGRHLQVFGSLTNMGIEGDNFEDFEEFSPRNATAGVSLVHKRLVAKLNMTYNKWVRRLPAAANANQPEGSYQIRQPSTRWDLSLEYRLHRRFALYFSMLNLTAEPINLHVNTPATPEFARPRNYQYVSTNYTLGFKGTF